MDKLRFGKKLRLLRKEKRLSQAELAEILCVSQSAISAWEKGLSVPSAIAIIRMVNFFDVSSDFLLGMDS